MSWFRSATARRILYVLMFALAFMRLARHAHSEPAYEGGPPENAAILQSIH